jgi:hypothetical protein
MERCKEDVPDIEIINNRSLELFTTIDNFKRVFHISTNQRLLVI